MGGSSQEGLHRFRGTRWKNRQKGDRGHDFRLVRDGAEGDRQLRHGHGQVFRRSSQGVIGRPDYRSLARITVWRSEIDLNRIKFVYKKIHGINVGNDIWGATSAEFRDTLMALMRASPPVGGEENEENEDQNEKKKKSEADEENVSLNRDA